MVSPRSVLNENEIKKFISGMEKDNKRNLNLN